MFESVSMMDALYLGQLANGIQEERRLRAL